MDLFSEAKKHWSNARRNLDSTGEMYDIHKAFMSLGQANWCLQRASKLLRPFPRPLPRAVLKHGRLGAAIWRLQRLWEQPSPGSSGSGSSHLEAPGAPGAPGAAISRLQRLWEQLSRGSRGSQGPSGFDLSFLEFSRVFSSLETSRGALPTAPGGSRRLSGSFEPAQEGFPVASSGLESAPKWPRSE